MSQYTTRIIEVRVSTSKGTSYKYENLVERYKDVAKEGDYFTLYENFKQKTIKYVNGEFVRTNEKIPKVWKLVKFYSNYDVKNIIVSDSDGEHPMFEPDGSINGEKVSSSNKWYNNGGYSYTWEEWKKSTDDAETLASAYYYQYERSGAGSPGDRPDLARKWWDYFQENPPDKEVPIWLLFKFKEGR